MADDDRLLELLGRALAPPRVEPPPERLAAFRAVVEQGRPAPGSEADAAAASGPEEAEPLGDVRQLPPLVRDRPRRRAAAAPVPPSAPPASPPPPVPDLAHRRARRVGWLAAGASVAAAAVVVAVLAVPSLITDRSTPDASVASAREAVARLRTALATGDAIAVAEADAELVRVAGKLPPAEQQQVHREAVSAHVQAIEFLREKRAPASPPPGGQVAAPPPPAPPPPRPAPPTTTAPAADPGSPSPSAPAPTAAPPEPAPARSVTIIVVSPEIDGSFEVVFGTAGFTPQPGKRPGTYAIRFSFDDGQSSEIWARSDPWRFPGEHAVTYRQVCAHVVDANGVVDPGSGSSCRPIL